MAGKRIAGANSGRGKPRGYLGSAYDTMTSAENASVVRSIAVFGAAVAFLASPLAEVFLLPPEI